MTRYRAIDIIKNEIECVNRQDTCEHKCADCELVLPDIEIFEAYDMAIKALSQEPCEKCEVGNPCLFCEHEFSQKIEPCDDVISRDALISKLTELIKTERSTIEIKAKLIPMIEQLPSVTQKPIECDDAVSREDAIKALQKVACYSAAIRARMIGAIEKLPSVTQKSGKWIEHEIEDTCRWLTCSNCGYEWINRKENFCPSCGAEMVGEKE